MIDRVPEELWTEVHKTVQEAVTKTIPKKKKCKKAKWLSEEGLQIADKRRKAKCKGEMVRYTQTEGVLGGARGKELACQCRRFKRHGFNSSVGKIPWRRAEQPTPVFLLGESHGERSLAGYSPQSCKESDMTEVTWHAAHTYPTECRVPENTNQGETRKLPHVNNTKKQRK